MRAEEIVISIPDGRSVTTLVYATPIISEEDAIETVVITMQDLTPLEEIERQRAGFLGTLSHELRAPLTSIKGSAGVLPVSPEPSDLAVLVDRAVGLFQSGGGRSNVRILPGGDVIGSMGKMLRTAPTPVVFRSDYHR